jgi:hypothetical protein
MDLAFWAPRWAVPKASDRNDRERYMPRPAEFGLFARALARRYSGGFADHDQNGRALPAVRLWVPWSEPNQPSFLMPQWRRDTRGLRPESPRLPLALPGRLCSDQERQPGQRRAARQHRSERAELGRRPHP